MLHQLVRFAQDYNTLYSAPDPLANSSISAGTIVIIVVLWLAFLALMLSAMWKVFVKAKRPGWHALVPIYNAYVVLKLVGRPGWWLLLYLVPFVNIVVAFIVCYEFAKVFGKGIGYMFVLMFLPYIGCPMLAWGDAAYKGPLHRA